MTKERKMFKLQNQNNKQDNLGDRVDFRFSYFQLLQVLPSLLVSYSSISVVSCASIMHFRVFSVFSKLLCNVFLDPRGTIRNNLSTSTNRCKVCVHANTLSGTCGITLDMLLLLFRFLVHSFEKNEK